jgi:hypothetical protein
VFAGSYVFATDLTCWLLRRSTGVARQSLLSAYVPQSGLNAVHLLIFPQLMRRYRPFRLSLASIALVLYGSWPTVHSATRLSPVSAYGRLLLLYAASLNAPPTSSCEVVGDQPSRIHLVHRPGAWCVRRSGIKEEAAALGRNGGQPRSCTHQAPERTQTRSPLPYSRAQAKSPPDSRRTDYS